MAFDSEAVLPCLVLQGLQIAQYRFKSPLEMIPAEGCRDELRRTCSYVKGSQCACSQTLCEVSQVFISLAVYCHIASQQ